MLKVKERDINAGIRSILKLDGCHVFLMETVSRREWGKFTGEPGMPDMLAIRYSHGGTPQSNPACAEVLWIEGKAPCGIVGAKQSLWHSTELARGALIWLAGHDFAADVDSFLEHY